MEHISLLSHVPRLTIDRSFLQLELCPICIKANALAAVNVETD